jgi:hypothetical protein
MLSHTHSFACVCCTGLLFRVVTGVLVSFLGYFSGGLDHNHMAGLTASGVGGWRAVCTVGAKVKARILMIDYAAKAIRYVCSTAVHI